MTLEISDESKKKYGRGSLLPLRNDFVFKRVFGIESHKRVLVCSLNAILNDKPKIKSIEIDRFYRMCIPLSNLVAHRCLLKLKVTFYPGVHF